MTQGEPTLDSPVEAKVSWAEACFDRESDRLLKDQSLVELLGELKNSIHRSHEQMLRAGIVHCCKECEEKEGGSCCGAGLERHFSSILLLMNLLLGASLPREREDPSSCFFLSRTGCLLLARHVLCINYVCDKITARIKPDELAALRKEEGEETLLLFRTNEKLKKLVR